MIWLALAGALFLIWFVLVFLFTPAIGYHARKRVHLDAPEFLRMLQATCQATLHRGNKTEVFTNGASYYPAMLAAIRAATRTINLECYIFQPGRVADQFIDALTERAANGVTVTVVLDAIGSSGSGADAARMIEAGIRVEFYQRLHWYALARINNRTHRELLIVDGNVAFTGGSGIADWWSGDDGARPWRDMMVRVDGPAVAGLQGVAAENWLECCGEILTGDEYFPSLEPAGGNLAFVVKSSPADRATASRVTFQLLIEGARREVLINTPYFLPDKALRTSLTGVARSGVRMSIVVPGPGTDQKWVRFASRRGYRDLLAAGIRIFEYQPSMMHCKMLIADDWAVVGTTNIDNRSFEHNDEVNLAIQDEQVTARLRGDHERDIADSREVTLDAWMRRPWWEKMLAPFIWILERQQ